MVNKLPDDPQTKKDMALERLWANTEIDPETGCFIFNGYWDEWDIGRMWCEGRNRTVARLAAWIYREDFELDGDQVVLHYRCQSPACWNFEHIRIVNSVGEQLRISGKIKRTPQPVRVLNFKQADMIRLQATTMTTMSLANEYGVHRRTIREVVHNLAWVRSERYGALA